MSGDVHFGLILALTIRGLAVAPYADMRRVAGDAEDLDFDSVWLCDHFLTLAPEAYVEDAGIARAADAAGASGDAARTGDAASGGATGASGRDRAGAARVRDGAGAAGAAASDRAASDGSAVADRIGAAGGGARSMPLLECWTALAALSRDTRRLRLGSSVLCNSYRLPSVLAKMAATLDVISEGRLDLGLGAGWFEKEYRAYGVPFPSIGERIAQLDEGVEVIRRMWTEPRPTFQGRHFSIEDAVVQRPHPPIWIGGEGDRVHRVAARAADGVNVRWWPPERIAARRAYLAAACREFGRDPAALQRSVTLLLIVDRDAARAQATRARYASIPATGHVAGTPEQCAARIREYLDAGVRHFLFTIPDVAASPALELAGRQVLPALRDAAARA
jgi:alkanesulfonate monooxygenase SsuD/methylene tetrahydromethanopterin reductase-like flavin-dependent oxidoreductase (luciferase family)